MSIESDADQDLALSDEDADSVIGGKMTKAKVKAKKVAPKHSTPAVTNQVVSLSGGAWQDADASVDPNSDPDC